MQKMTAKELVDDMTKHVRDDLKLHPVGAVALETSKDPCTMGTLLTGDLWCVDDKEVRRRFTKTVLLKEAQHV